MKLYLGIDIGGTRIKTVVINDKREIIDKNECSTNDNINDPTLWKNKVKNIITEKTKKFSNGDKNKLICGISAPGLSNNGNKVIWHMPERLIGIEGYDWGKELDREIWVINDAHSATLAEYNTFFSNEFKNMILLTLGTGVGGGIIINGGLYKGHLNRGGHFGHFTLDSNGPMTMTNLPGSVEYAIGDYSIKERTHGFFDNTYDLVEAYKKNDPLATYWWLSSINKIAIGLASLINILSPEIIVIGGGIASAKDCFFKPLNEFMELYEWKPKNNHVKITSTRFGNYAGAVGAALFAQENHKHKI